jgi:hypothetical protein
LSRKLVSIPKGCGWPEQNQYQESKQTDKLWEATSWGTALKQELLRMEGRMEMAQGLRGAQSVRYVFILMGCLELGHVLTGFFGFWLLG